MRKKTDASPEAVGPAGARRMARSGFAEGWLAGLDGMQLDFISG